MRVEYWVNKWTGLIGIGFGVGLWLLIPYQIGNELIASTGITSKSLPYAIAILFFSCGCCLLFSSLVLKKDHLKTIIIKEEVKAIAYIGILIVFSLLIKWNFIIAMLILGGTTLAFMKSKKVLYYIIVILFAVGLYFIFTQVLRARL